MRMVILGAAGLALASVASAQAPADQPYGLAAIQRADYSAAEARLSVQRLAEPDEPSVLLNLAYVYAKTGRTAESAALYGKVLSSENVMMNTAAGQSAWSHDIAERAMARTQARAMASR